MHVTQEGRVIEVKGCPLVPRIVGLMTLVAFAGGILAQEALVLPGASASSLETTSVP